MKTCGSDSYAAQKCRIDFTVPKLLRTTVMQWSFVTQLSLVPFTIVHDGALAYIMHAFLSKARPNKFIFEESRIDLYLNPHIQPT